MNTNFDEGSVRERAEKISHLARIAFVLSCAERLFPNYKHFYEKHRWGDPDSLRSAMDTGWSVLKGEIPNWKKVEELRRRCDAALPDTEDFDSVYVSPALDAGVVSLELLTALSDESIKPMLTSARLAVDTVDMYVQELENLSPQDSLLEEKILRHPLMQQELMRQASDLNTLSEISEEEFSDQAASLALRWRSPHTSSIGLS